MKDREIPVSPTAKGPYVDVLGGPEFPAFGIPQPDPPPIAWTRECPSRVGYYWYRAAPGDPPDFGPVAPEVVQIVGRSLSVSLVGSDVFYGLADLSGWWLGPLTPPEPPRAD
jgi:hypothetical protein